jgi:hypothetical protein
VWDTTGDDCAGDISSALFAIHNGRLFIAGLRSYAETNNDVCIYLLKFSPIFLSLLF